MHSNAIHGRGRSCFITISLPILASYLRNDGVQDSPKMLQRCQWREELVPKSKYEQTKKGDKKSGLIAKIYYCKKTLIERGLKEGAGATQL